MKTHLTAIAAAVFLLFPITVFAAYVIHLKDGTKFVTDQYFEEGDQIKFKRYGGLVGIEKDRIREIEETESLPEKMEAAKPETTLEPEKVDDVKKGEAPEAAETDNDSVDIEYYKREKQRLEQELNEAKRRYISSLEKGDKQAKHAASKDALKINTQIDQLRKELEEKNKGILPEWWNE